MAIKRRKDETEEQFQRRKQQEVERISQKALIGAKDVVFKPSTEEGKGFAIPAREDPELAAKQKEQRRLEDEAQRQADITRLRAEGVADLLDVVEKKQTPQTPEGQTPEGQTPEQLPPGITPEDIAVFGSVEAVQAAQGTVTPITPGDVASVATLGLGGLPFKLGGKAAVARGTGGLLNAPAEVSFLTRAAEKGAIYKGGSEVLKASAKSKAINSNILLAAGTILAYSGLGSIKDISKNLLTKKVEAIEGEVGKVGEQLTKIAEAQRLGFSIDESGKVFEYTAELALQDVDDIEQSLEEAETALQTSIIGQAYLKLTGRYQKTQLEIDKQKKEIRVARAKILSTEANPSEALLNSRDFFREVELIRSQRRQEDEPSI